MDNSTPDMSEKLVLYLDGELTGAEKTSLEQELSVNPGLQEALSSLQSAIAGVKLYGLQQTVAGIHGEMMKEWKTPVRKISSTRSIIRYTIAVAASLLLIVGSYMAYNFFTLSPDKVFASRYQSYELATLRDDNTSETAVEKAYREKNYKEVLRIHDAGLDHTPKGEFLCGAAALEVKDNTKAIKCFNEVIVANKQSAQPVLNDEAEYYLSLSYVRNRDYDYALDIMNKIREEPDHKYHSAVTAKLVRQVKMLKWR